MTSQMPADAGVEPRVSVVIPTYHRPRLLGATVGSVLSQDVPEGSAIEVIVVVSDAEAAEDREAAAALAARDPRVSVAIAARPGPGVARNAGIRASSAPIIAFLDDDCIAQPGWLEAGLEAIQRFDIVQGRTMPPVPHPPNYHHTLWIQSKTLLWETCNLFVRRSAIERGGVFDETFNPTGRVGGHWGEDVEWGWRLLRAGARDGFAPGALVHHEVLPRSYWGYLKYRSRIRYFPFLFRGTPEARAIFYGGRFLNRRHVVLVGVAALSGSAAVLRASGHRPGARLAAAAAVLAYLSPVRHGARAGHPNLDVLHPREMLREAVELGSLVYGSVRWRRILL